MSDPSIKHISSVLKKISKDYGLDQKMNEQKVVSDWAIVVGEKISRVSKAERIFESILYVRMDSQVWRTELLFQKAKILEQINARAGSTVIKDIKFI